MSTELKPCPFCNSELVKHPLYYSWSHRDGAYNMCPLAGHMVNSPEHWNTRAPDPGVKELEAEVNVQNQVIRMKEDRIRLLEEFITCYARHEAGCGVHNGLPECDCYFFKDRKALNL